MGATLYGESTMESILTLFEYGPIYGSGPSQEGQGTVKILFIHNGSDMLGMTFRLPKVNISILLYSTFFFLPLHSLSPIYCCCLQVSTFHSHW